MAPAICGTLLSTFTRDWYAATLKQSTHWQQFLRPTGKDAHTHTHTHTHVTWQHRV